MGPAEYRPLPISFPSRSAGLLRSASRRIRDLCGEAGVRFSYRQEHGCTSIVFDRPGSQIEGGGSVPTTGDEPSTINEDREQALALFSEADSLTSKEVAERLGISLRQAQRTLKSLETDGLIVRSGRGRSTAWTRPGIDQPE